MNQQQRAGKHPSFSRDKKPYGMEKETFHKKNITPRSKGRRGCKHSCRGPKMLRAHWILVDMGIRTITPEIESARREIMNEKSWLHKFNNEQYKQAREDLLHVAAIEAISNEKYDQALRILPQISDKKLVMCVLNTTAAYYPNTYFLRCMKKAYEKSGEPHGSCLKDALHFRQWFLVKTMMKCFEFSSEQADDILSTAVLNENWKLIQESLKHKVSRRLLHTALIQALMGRQWGIVEACLKHGGDIATACVEHGFNLNIKNGDLRQTVLQDAIFHCSLTQVDLLLQAGADPDIRNRDGETAICRAVVEQEWDLATLLLKYSNNAGKIASKRIAGGETLLHIICRNGQADILHTLLLMEANPLVTNVDGVTLLMTAVQAGEEAENLVRILLQLGAATHQGEVSRSQLATTGKGNNTIDRGFDTPMWRAVEKGQLCIAKMLYASGGCCAKEIHAMAASEFMRKTLESSKLRDIVDFLNDISSHPRSLLDSCALKISHLIGCGSERDVRAASLGLPNKLRGLVLQDHVVNPDFLKDCPPGPPGPPSHDIFSGWVRLSWGTHFTSLRDYEWSQFRRVFEGMRPPNSYMFGVKSLRRLPRCSCKDIDQ
ncbi:uncharacterized protein [Littorina saxatilis]|uniref:Uncharacterized protein n=1 Tax=Littorina saxatilis TaxID=31220 RepID=A0AAN9GHN9_9CAEN